jgi:hypothetical protein
MVNASPKIAFSACPFEEVTCCSKKPLFRLHILESLDLAQASRANLNGGDALTFTNYEQRNLRGISVVTQSEHTLIGKIEKYFVVCECDVRSMPASSLFTKRFLKKGSSLSAQPHPNPSLKIPSLHREYPSIWERPRSFDNTYIHCSTVCRLPKARKRFPDRFSRGCPLIHIHIPKNRFWVPLQAVSV